MSELDPENRTVTLGKYPETKCGSLPRFRCPATNTVFSPLEVGRALQAKELKEGLTARLSV